MILSDVDIRAAIKHGNIKITPEVADEDIQPCTIDLHLGNKIIVFDKLYRYKAKENRYLDVDTIILRPKEFILAELKESITIDNTLCANIEGKSSLGRQGIFAHVTAGFIDPGWSGVLTLEIYNGFPDYRMLTVGQKICQIKFSKLITLSERGYGHKDLKSHYQNSTKVEVSRS